MDVSIGKQKLMKNFDIQKIFFQLKILKYGGKRGVII
jgi:hypothetical protein